MKKGNHVTKLKDVDKTKEMLDRQEKTDSGRILTLAQEVQYNAAYAFYNNRKNCASRKQSCSLKQSRECQPNHYQRWLLRGPRGGERTIPELTIANLKLTKQSTAWQNAVGYISVT